MIEASSPLAAMQPPSFLGHYGYGFDAPQSYASLAAAKSLGPNSFNFKDLSMMRKPSIKRSQSDYFNLGPMRGSSPTASLAADLSQNFHIDQSPQLPTPRRALFSTGIFGGAKCHVSLTTPPIPTSSPGAVEHMDMDVSPLPHKAPFTTIELQLQSPTPDLISADSSILSVESMPCDPLPEPMQLSLPLERRKTGPLRPSLSKTKCLSSSTVPQRPVSESNLPQFRFGNFSTQPTTSSALSLSEIFEQSPEQEDFPSKVGGPVLPFSRPRAPLMINQITTSRNGSPMGQHLRKSSNPLVRPRKQFRRSLSMFEHPDDVMRQGKDTVAPSLLPSVMDVEATQGLRLPHFVSDEQTGDLPRITKETMVEILDGRYNSHYEKLVVIDCRFEYEYLGGHIEGAVNFNDKEKLAAQLFDIEPTTNALLIFHCEYSAHRAPLMAKFIRNKDRAVNADNYPHLTYSEAYILDGGYSSFFKDHSARCFPQNYVEMDAKEHQLDCERGLGKVKQRTKLVRARTFAFGQHSPAVDSSPTAMGRSRIDSDMDIDMALDYTPAALSRPGMGSLRGRTQRMFSY